MTALCVLVLKLCLDLWLQGENINTTPFASGIRSSLYFSLHFVQMMALLQFKIMNSSICIASVHPMK